MRALALWLLMSVPAWAQSPVEKEIYGGVLGIGVTALLLVAGTIFFFRFIMGRLSASETKCEAAQKDKETILEKSLILGRDAVEAFKDAKEAHERTAEYVKTAHEDNRRWRDEVIALLRAK